MNFADSTQYLFSLGNEVSAMKLGLENIRKLLTTLGNPQNNYLKVQVAGTNGKGSVCAFLDSICNRANIKTGTFTSPHLISITERIRIDGRDISEKNFAQQATRIRETAEQMLASGNLKYRPTFFEQITAIALTAFADAGVELAILETGLGGRLDATTAANAEIAVITRIDYDHQEYLGNTLTEIALEKAAIIRSDSKVITLHQSREVEQAISGRCREVGVEPIWTPKAIEIKEIPVILPALYGSIQTSKALYKGLEFWDMLGKHQFENAAVAIEVAQLLSDYAFNISEDRIPIALMNAHNPGRLEYIGKFLFDGAHNIGGAKALAAYLAEFERQPITLIFGAMRGKDVGQISNILFPMAARIVLTEPGNSRALTCEELLQLLPVDISQNDLFVSSSVENAVGIAENITPDDNLILVTGSLYLVGEVKKILQSQI